MRKAAQRACTCALHCAGIEQVSCSARSITGRQAGGVGWGKGVQGQVTRGAH